jgi:NAD(P)-dependent dehydrogenase (short-subunit alcohol dehydrogenase family)
LAQRFAREGMKVVMADIEEVALAQAESEVREQGGPVLGVLTNVSKAKEVEALAERTLQTFGAIHVLCNNAGVAGDTSLSWEQTLESWEWVIGVNLWGVIHGIRVFVPHMLDQGTEGHVVNTASTAGLIRLPFGVPCYATKHAAVAITECLHHELAVRGAAVKASVLCPGWVRTNIMDADRNRPVNLHTPPRPLPKDEQKWAEACREFVAVGLPPEEVADRAFEAVRDEKFYILPNPGMDELLRARLANVGELRNPTVDFLPDPVRQLFQPQHCVAPQWAGVPRRGKRGTGRIRGTNRGRKDLP